MEQLFNKLFPVNAVNPPDHVKMTIYKMFKHPFNIDWYLKNNIYEAIFYETNREHIARIDKHGTLLDYKINLPLDALPEGIKKIAESKGEIMNIVSIHNNDNIGYELIIRDAELKRYIIKINGGGKITEEKLL
jgi:hypothetical protein